MACEITIRKSAVKILEEINEPHYSKIKKAIYNLADNPRPSGYKKLKAETGIVFMCLTTELFMKFSMMY